MRTVLLTGAGGNLGRLLTPALRAAFPVLRLSDLDRALAGLAEPEAVPCDLADAVAVDRLLRGVDAVLHLGGVSVEGPFEAICEANLRGVRHLYEAARRHGVKRVVFASSNHVVGAYPVGTLLTEDCEPAPDGDYGASKLYGEGLARLHWERYGIESVVLRIGTATPEPFDRRSLATWLSPRDLTSLVLAALTAPRVGYTVAWGVSDNPRRWWNGDAGWARLGWRPQDSAEPWAARCEGVTFPEGSAMAACQGGSFLGIGPFDAAAVVAARKAGAA